MVAAEEEEEEDEEEISLQEEMVRDMVLVFFWTPWMLHTHQRCVVLMSFTSGLIGWCANMRWSKWVHV